MRPRRSPSPPGGRGWAERVPAAGTVRKSSRSYEPETSPASSHSESTPPSTRSRPPRCSSSASAAAAPTPPRWRRGSGPSAASLVSRASRRSEPRPAKESPASGPGATARAARRARASCCQSREPSASCPGSGGSSRFPADSSASASRRMRPSGTTSFASPPPRTAPLSARVKSSRAFVEIDCCRSNRYGNSPRVASRPAEKSSVASPSRAPRSADAVTVPNEPPVSSADQVSGEARRVMTFTTPPRAPAP